MTSESHERTNEVQPGKPVGGEEGVRPTIAPLIVAIGIFFGLWGIQASWIFSAFGAATFIVGVWIWLREVNRQWRMRS